MKFKKKNSDIETGVPCKNDKYANPKLTRRKVLSRRALCKTEFSAPR